MYRSIANFGIWCTSHPTSSLNRTQTVSTIASTKLSISAPKIEITGTVPEFHENMIRQRISTHGIVRQMEPSADIPALNLPVDQICIIHPGPTKRWLAAKQKWDTRYAKQKRHVQLARGREYIEAQKRGFLGGKFVGEMPPPSALAGRPSVLMAMEESMQAEKKKGKNFAGWMWGRMGGKEDREKEEGLDEVKEGDDKPVAASTAAGAT
jgi:hypothetical protein